MHIPLRHSPYPKGQPVYLFCENGHVNHDTVENLLQIPKRRFIVRGEDVYGQTSPDPDTDLWCQKRGQPVHNCCTAIRLADHMQGSNALRKV